MIDHMTVSAVARELGPSRDTVNAIVVDATQMIVAADTHRLDGVRVIGVDEHRWSHTRGQGEGFATVIVDLTLRSSMAPGGLGSWTWSSAARDTH